MEGVLVTAKKTGSTISITVVSDETGHYRFRPANWSRVNILSACGRLDTRWTTSG